MGHWPACLSPQHEPAHLPGCINILQRSTVRRLQVALRSPLRLFPKQSQDSSLGAIRNSLDTRLAPLVGSVRSCMIRVTPRSLAGNPVGRIFDPRPAIAAVLLLGNLSCSGTRPDATDPGCCQAGLLSAAKLLSANLPGTPAHRNVSTVIWSSPHVCDLSSYLAAGAAKS